MRLAKYRMGTRAALATIVLPLLEIDGRVNHRLTGVPAIVGQEINVVVLFSRDP